MFNEIKQNLTQNQKLGIFIVSQILVVIVAAILFSINPSQPKGEINFNNPQDSIDLSSFKEIPEKNQQEIKQNLYDYLSKKFPTTDFTHTPISIRTESFSIKTNNTNKSATFLIDIDNLKQTFKISYAWSPTSTNKLPSNFSVDCPQNTEMKYEGTFCEGMYNDTSSPSLYLPHSFLAENNNDGYYMEQKRMPDGTNTIKITINACETDMQNHLKEEAKKYLDSTAIKQNEYDIEYQNNCYKKP